MLKQSKKNQLPTLSSRRMILRPMTMDDLDLLDQLNTDPEVHRYIFPNPKSIEESRSDLEKYIQYPEKYQMPIGLWIGLIKNTNERVGMYVIKRQPTTNEIEIGYRLARVFWNKGYATEGAKRLLEYGLEELDFKRIVAVVHQGNTASVNVIQKLGFIYEHTDVYYNTKCKYYAYDLKGKDVG